MEEKVRVGPRVCEGYQGAGGIQELIDTPPEELAEHNLMETSASNQCQVMSKKQHQKQTDIRRPGRRF